MGTGRMQSQGMETRSRDRVTGLSREGILEVLPDGRFHVLSTKEVQERQAGAERQCSRAGESPPLVLPAGYRESAQRGGRAGHGAFSRRGFLKTVGFGSAALAAGQETSKGIVMDPGTPDSEYLALGAQCALKPGRPLYVVGFDLVLGQLIYGSAAFLNERFAIGAAHVFAVLDPIDTRTKFFTGNDLYADSGLLLRPLRKSIFPGFTLGNYNVPDVALMEFSEPVAAFQKAVIAEGLVARQTVIGAGYGRAGTPGVQLPDADQYKLRAYRAPTEDHRPPGYLEEAYFSSYFRSGNFMNGRGNPGDSGSPVYDQDYKLIGITSSVSGGVNAPAGGGYTFFSRLDYPELRLWIESVAGTFEQQPPPAPGATYVIEGNQFCVKAPWPEVANLNPAGKWQVQESPDLSAWGTALDFVQEGTFGVVRRPLGQRAYFRLRWKPG